VVRKTETFNFFQLWFLVCLVRKHGSRIELLSSFFCFCLLLTEIGVVSGLITQSIIKESGKVDRSKLYWHYHYHLMLLFL
jgi:hypothetical protein